MWTTATLRRMAQNPSASEYTYLLPSQVRALVGWAADEGLSETALVVTNAPGPKVRRTRVEIPETPWHFEVFVAGGSYTIRQSPGPSSETATLAAFATDFARLEPPFRAWVSFALREMRV